MLGAAKVAAIRIGCTLERYLEQRAAGLQWCGRCRTWQAKTHRQQCYACRRELQRTRDMARRKRRPVREPDAPSTHPPQRCCSCEACLRARRVA